MLLRSVFPPFSNPAKTIVTGIQRNKKYQLQATVFRAHLRVLSFFRIILTMVMQVPADLCHRFNTPAAIGYREHMPGQFQLAASG